jgi:hypothetical protein
VVQLGSPEASYRDVFDGEDAPPDGTGPTIRATASWSNLKDLDIGAPVKLNGGKVQCVSPHTPLV